MNSNFVYMMMPPQFAPRFVMLVAQALWPPSQIDPTICVVRLGTPLCFWIQQIVGLNFGSPKFQVHLNGIFMVKY